MDVHHPHGKGLKEKVRQNPHETRHHDQFDIVNPQDIDHFSVEIFPVGVILMTDDCGREIVFSRSLQGIGVRVVAYDHLYFCIKAALFDMVYD